MEEIINMLMDNPIDMQGGPAGPFALPVSSAVLSWQHAVSTHFGGGDESGASSTHDASQSPDISSERSDGDDASNNGEDSCDDDDEGSDGDDGSDDGEDSSDDDNDGPDEIVLDVSSAFIAELNKYSSVTRRPTNFDQHSAVVRTVAPAKTTEVQIAGVSTKFHILEHDSARHLFPFDDPSCGAVDLLHGRTIEPWGDGTLIPAAVQKHFDAVVALGPAASDSVHVCIEIVRKVLVFAETSLRSYRSWFHGACIKALKLLVRAGKLEASRERRNEPALPLQPMLNRAHRYLCFLHDEAACLASQSLVQRSRVQRVYFESIWAHGQTFESDLRSLNEMAHASGRQASRHRRRPHLSLQLSISASSMAQDELCGESRYQCHKLSEAQVKESTRLPDPLRLFELYSFATGTLMQQPEPLPGQSLVPWLEQGKALHERLRGRSPPSMHLKDAAAVNQWLHEAVRYDLCEDQLRFDFFAQVRIWRTHAQHVVSLFGLSTEQLHGWEFSTTSTQLQTAIVAYCHLARYTEAVTFAELLVMHCREVFELDTTSSSARLRLVHAFGLYGYTLIGNGQALNAFRAAEAGLDLLRPLLAAPPSPSSKHAGLMARLYFLSYCALKMHPSPHLAAIRDQKLDAALPLFEQALQIHPRDLALKCAYVRACESVEVRSQQRSQSLVSAFRVLQELDDARPQVFALTLAAFVVRNAVEMAKPAPGDAVPECVDICIALISIPSRYRTHILLLGDFYPEALVQAYRQLAAMYDHRFWDADKAEGFLWDAIMERMRDKPAPKEDGTKVDSTAFMHFYRAHLLFRQEKYDIASQLVGKAYLAWRAGSGEPEDVLAKQEYIQARACFHGAKSKEDLFTADRLFTDSLRRMRMRALRDGTPAEADPDFARAMGFLGAVKAVLGESADALLHGRRSVALGNRLLKGRKMDGKAVREPCWTNGGSSAIVCDDELQVQVAELHLLYAASLVAAGRLEQSLPHISTCTELLQQNLLDVLCWCGPVYKTMRGLVGHVVESMGGEAVMDRSDGKLPWAPIFANSRGYFHDLVPMRRAELLE